MMTPKEVILVELYKIHLEAQRRASDDLLYTSIYNFLIDGNIEIGHSILPKNLCIQVAMLKGLTVNTYNKLSYMASRPKEKLASGGRQQVCG